MSVTASGCIIKALAVFDHRHRKIKSHTASFAALQNRGGVRGLQRAVLPRVRKSSGVICAAQSASHPDEPFPKERVHRVDSSEYLDLSGSAKVAEDTIQVDDWDVVVDDVNEEFVIIDDKQTQELFLSRGPLPSLAGFIRNLGVSVLKIFSKSEEDAPPNWSQTGYSGDVSSPEEKARRGWMEIGVKDILQTSPADA